MIKLQRRMSLRKLAFDAIGALLVFAGIGLVAMTARGVLNYRAAEARHGGEVINLGQAASPQAGQHGYMARIVGTPRVVEPPHDPDFNQRGDSPLLTRHVEMFQWREIRIGDSVHYELDWVDRPLDASQYRAPAGHQNPGAFPIQTKEFDAGLVQLNGFRLAPKLVRALPGSAQLEPDATQLPANLAASFSLHQGHLLTSAHPGDPRLGDLRVSWEEVPLQQMTIIARIDGDQLTPALDAPDGKGYDVEIGDVSMQDIFPDMPVAPTFVTGGRLLAILLATLGAGLLLADHQRRDPLLALALGLLVVGTVAAVLWVGKDTSAMLSWLIVAVAGLLLAGWRLQRRLPPG
jgi:hypothetical protein